MHFPENEIILQIDGLREERLNRKADYDEFKSRVLWKCLHEWKNVLPIIFDATYEPTGSVASGNLNFNSLIFSS